MIKVIPAILPLSYGAIVHGLNQVHSLVNTVQIDFVDGLYASNRTWFLNGKDKEIFNSILREEEAFPYWDELDFEFDLMVKDPLKYIDEFIALGPSKIIFHLNSFDKDEMLNYFENLPYIIQKTISFGMAIGIDDNPKDLEPFIEYIDTIQCMGIKNIGLQGQAFDDGVLLNIKKSKELYPDKNISVDGGVNLDTAKLMVEAGANTLVAGSFIFNSSDMYGTIELLSNIDYE